MLSLEQMEAIATDLSGRIGNLEAQLEAIAEHPPPDAITAPNTYFITESGVVVSSESGSVQLFHETLAGAEINNNYAQAPEFKGDSVSVVLEVPRLVQIYARCLMTRSTEPGSARAWLFIDNEEANSKGPGQVVKGETGSFPSRWLSINQEELFATPAVEGDEQKSMGVAYARRLPAGEHTIDLRFQREKPGAKVSNRQILVLP